MSCTRRTALESIAAFAALTTGGCGAVHGMVRAAGRARSCADVRVPEASGVDVLHGIIPTRHVASTVRYAIAMPAGARGLRRVAYLLPGRGGSADALTNLGFDGFLAQYLRNGGVPFLIAAMDAGESYFHRRVSGEDRLAVATVDLPAVVRRVLGTERLREALLGQSMGGYGALLAAEREPRRYRAVAVAGPAIFPSFEDENRSVGDAFDSAADYARNDVIARAASLRGTPVRIAAGTRDPFLPGIRRFARALPGAQLNVTPGCHDDGFWRASAAASVAFVGTHLT